MRPDFQTVYFGNTPIAVIQNGNIYRIYADQIDTPRTITDATGKTVWAWDSKPFGETAPDEDPDKDGLSLHYSQRFPGQTFDAETGLHYNFHRDYNPQTGRYVQSDPIGLGGGLNTFGYVGGIPTKFIDLLGQNIAVVVGDRNLEGYNIFGHAAMAVSSKGVYSFGTSRYKDGSSLCTYLKEQVAVRNITVDIISSFIAQDSWVISGFNSVRQRGYSVFYGNTCATAVSYGLWYAGISGFNPTTYLPMELQRYAQNSPARYRGIYFAQGSKIDCTSLNYKQSLGEFR